MCSKRVRMPQKPILNDSVNVQARRHVESETARTIRTECLGIATTATQSRRRCHREHQLRCARCVGCVMMPSFSARIQATTDRSAAALQHLSWRLYTNTYRRKAIPWAYSVRNVCLCLVPTTSPVGQHASVTRNVIYVVVYVVCNMYRLRCVQSKAEHFT